MKANLAGFIVSALLHAGVVGVIVNASYLPEKVKKPKTHQLTVSLFQEEKKPIPTPPVLTQNSQKTEPEIVHKKPAKPVVKVAPKPEKIAKPDLKKEPVTIAAVKPEIIPTVEKPVIAPKPAKAIVALKKKPIVKRQKPKLKKKPIVHRPKPIKRKIRKKKKPVVHRVVRKPVSKPIRKNVRKPVIAKAKPRPRPRVIPRPKHRPKPRKIVRARVKPPVRYVPKKPRVQPKPRRSVAIRTQQRRAQRRPQQRPQRRSQPHQNYRPQQHARRAPVAKKHVKTGGVGSRKVVKRAVVARKPVHQQAPRKAYKKPAQYHAPSSARKASPNTAQMNNLAKQYKARLHQIIAGLAKKNYPRRAKRRNQQGRVTVSFSISHSGTISHVKVIKGSGFPVLDKAAIKAIQQVSHQLPFLSGMSKKALQLKMTVVYTLRG